MINAAYPFAGKSMKTNFKELLDKCISKEEDVGLNQLILMAITLRQMNRLRMSKDEETNYKNYR